MISVITKPVYLLLYEHVTDVLFIPDMRGKVRRRST